MNKRLNTILLILAAMIGIAMPAAASYLPFNTNVNMNVGIGTTTPEGALTVMNGNVGIGTWVPSYALHVQGVGEFTKAVYTTNLLSGASGFTLSVSGGGVSAGGGITYVGATAPIAPGTLQFLTGTASGAEPERMRIDANGNVGIGSWGQNNLVNTFSVVGNIGIGTNQSSTFVQTSAPNGGMIVQNNVGIGSLTPGQALDVNGTVRMTGIILTGNGAANGNVLVGNSVGVGTWMPVSTLGAAGGSNYWLKTAGAGNVGISTSYTVGIGTTSGIGAGLVVMNGNVGIGTWAPLAPLQVVGIGTQNINGGGIIVTNGNVGIGTFLPGYLLDVENFNLTGTAIYGSSASFSQNDAGVIGFNSSSGLGVLGNSLSGIGVVALNTSSNNPALVASSFNGGPAAIFQLGNVGIGTSSPEGALTVMSGNVGIGTWVPGYELETEGGSVGLGVNSNTSFLQIGQLANSQSVPNGLSLKDYITSTASNQSEAEVEAIARVASNTGNTFFGVVGDVNNNLAASVNYTATVGLAGVAGYTTSSGSGVITGAVSIYAGNSSYTGSGGGITNAYGLFVSDQTAATNNYGIYSGVSFGVNKWNIYMAGTAPNYFNGNVGIGSLTPGQLVDVQGTVRMKGLTLTGNGAANGNVLVGNSVGVGTWMPASTLGISGGSGTDLWLNDTGNIGISTAYAVGIGTISQVNKLNVLGNIGIGTFINDQYMRTAAPNGGMIISGNVGIGTWRPSTTLEVDGGAVGAFGLGPTDTAPAIFSASGSGNHTNYIVINNNDGAGNVSNGIAFDSAGTELWSIVNDYANTGSQNLAILNIPVSSDIPVMLIDALGNVGIGTVTPAGALAVMNGNVGIGTWAPALMLDVKGTARMTGLTLTGNGAANGNVLVGNSVGVGTWMPASTLGVSGGSGTNYWLNDTGNVGISTAYAVGIGTISQINKLNILGNIGIGTFSNDQYMRTAAPNGGMIISGRVGIGTWVPGNSLEISGGNIGIGTVFSLNVINTTSTILTMRGDTTSVYLGYQSGASASGGGANAAVGFQALANGGLNNTAVGYQALNASSSAADTAVGEQALVASNGIHETALGRSAGAGIVGGGYNVNSHDSLYLGSDTLALADGDTDEIVIGAAAVGIGSYSVVLGESNIATTQLQGNVGIGTSTPQGGLVVTNGNVGIGTWAPQAALQVNGSIKLNTSNPSIANTGFSAGGSSLTIIGGPSNTSSLILQATSSLISAGDTDNIRFLTGTGASEAMRINKSGNVGIGTTLSTNPFDLSGSAAIGIDYAGFKAAPSNGLIVQGNIGIGSFSPASKLTVNGGVSIGTTAFGSTGGGFLHDNSAPQGGLLVQNNVGIGSLAPGQSLDIQGTARMIGLILTGNGAANGNVLVGNSVGVGTWMPASTLAASGASSSNYWLNNSGGNVGINTSYAVGIGTSFVGGTGEAALSIMNGNVGIGTWVPAAMLDIGNANQGEVQIGNGTVGVSNELAIGGLGDGIFFAGSNGFGTISGSGATNPFYLSLGTDVNSNVLVLSKNNVGIGTINPQGGLTVMSGNVGIGTWAPIVPMQIVGIGTQAPYGGGLIINNGNVGIGTTVPTSALYVGSGVITSFNALEANGEGILTYVGNGKAINMQAGTANANILYDNTGGFSFQSAPRGTVLAGISSSSNITMMIDTNGNVGIGTNQSILGELIVQSGNVGIGTNRPQTALVVLGNQGIGTWTAAGGNLIVNGGGNVGIGSAWPGTMLDVQGTIRSLGQITNGNVTVASGGQFSGRITRRLVVVTQSATPSINTDTMDIASITGLAQAITSMTSGLTGTPNNGDMLMIQITDNGTARGITWGASFASTTVYTLPSTTVASTLLRVLLQYNSATGHWECIGVD